MVNLQMFKKDPSWLWNGLRCLPLDTGQVKGTSRSRFAACPVQVVNLELPSDGAHYAHRAGRTGRIGRHGNVISLLEHSVSCSNVPSVPSSCSLGPVLTKEKGFA